MLQILSSVTEDPAGMRCRRKSWRKQTNAQSLLHFTVYFRPNMKIKMRMVVHGAGMLTVMLSVWCIAHYQWHQNQWHQRPSSWWNPTQVVMVYSSKWRSVSSDHVIGSHGTDVEVKLYLLSLFSFWLILLSFHVSPIPFPQTVDLKWKEGVYGKFDST